MNNVDFNVHSSLHFSKMKEILKEIKTANRYTTSRTSLCFTSESGKYQFQSDWCLICGKNIWPIYQCSRSDICKDKSHELFNFRENLKGKIEQLLGAIERCDKAQDFVQSAKYRKMLAVYAVQLSFDHVTNIEGHNTLLRAFGLDDQVLS